MTLQNLIIFIVCLIIWSTISYKDNYELFIYKNTLGDDTNISYENFKLYGKSRFIIFISHLMVDLMFLYVLFWKKEIYYLLLVGFIYCFSKGFRYMLLNNAIYLKDMKKEDSLIISLNVFNDFNCIEKRIFLFKIESAFYEKISVTTDIGKCNYLFFDLLSNKKNILFNTRYGLYTKEKLPELFKKLINDFPDNNKEKYNRYVKILKEIYFGFYKKDLNSIIEC